MVPRPPSPRLERRRQATGSALLAVLWVVALLGIVVFTSTQFLFLELESGANAATMFRAEQAADRGIALAAHPRVKRGDPLLSQDLGGGESFLTRISSEGERLNLNTLLQSPEDDRIVLEELFYQWGLRSDEAREAVDNLIDWVDSDFEPTNLGVERPYYLGLGRENHPFNRPFRSLEEVPLVKDFDLVISANPDWRDAFTLLGSGQLDLNEAPAELISAACQSPIEPARQFVDSRNGPDRLPGTWDDVRYESLEDVFTVLEVPVDIRELVSPRVTLEDQTKRIVSVGRSGSIEVERTATVQYNGESGSVLRWSTRRLR